MKFYFVYEQAFPFGFGLAAAVCCALGCYGLLRRRPSVYPFLLSMLIYVGVLVPLFMLSLNHFWVAWPLGLGTLLLNGFGMVGTTAILAVLWVFKFEHTIIGASRAAVTAALKDSYPALDESKVVLWPLFWGSICYLRTPADESNAGVRENLKKNFREKQISSSLIGPLLCILFGTICAIVAGTSWCVSTQCLASFS